MKGSRKKYLPDQGPIASAPDCPLKTCAWKHLKSIPLAYSVAVISNKFSKENYLGPVISTARMHMVTKVPRVPIPQNTLKSDLSKVLHEVRIFVKPENEKDGIGVDICRSKSGNGSDAH